jgi:broad specificity phosphatase PhoE
MRLPFSGAMKIYLIRHGETDWNRELRTQGISDTTLNSTGMEQAEKLARTLVHGKFGAVYSSPLKRASATAEMLASRAGLKVRFIQELVEMNQGELEGKNLAEMTELFPDVIAKWLDDPSDIRLPGGETMREVQSRGWRAVEMMVSENPGSDVVAVSHNLLILGVLCMALGLELKYFRRLKQDSTAMNVIEHNNGRFRVLRVNDTCHLHAPH